MLRENVEGNWDDILKSDTKNAMHLNISAIPDQAFKYLLMRINAISKDLAIVTLNVKDQNGNPARQVEIENLIGLEGTNVFTDDLGVASGYGSVGSTSFKISEYGDIEDSTLTKDLIQGGEYQFDWQVTRRNYLRVNASRSVKFTPDCNLISYSLCGGGGGGGNSYNAASASEGGGGGGGGYSVIKENSPIMPNKAYLITIGNGGNAAAIGGTTNFLETEASGGNPPVKTTYNATQYITFQYQAGGVGNGNGGNGGCYTSTGDSRRAGESGKPGTQLFYKSYTETETVGGGGGGAKSRYGSGSDNLSGGAPNGGAAGNYADSTDAYGFKNPTSGKQPGGGGGGSSGTEHAVGNNGAKGGNGAAAIRMHLSIPV